MEKGYIFGDAYIYTPWKKVAYSEMHIYIYTMEKGCIFGYAYMHHEKGLHIRRYIYIYTPWKKVAYSEMHMHSPFQMQGLSGRLLDLVLQLHLRRIRQPSRVKGALVGV